GGDPETRPGKPLYERSHRQGGRPLSEETTERGPFHLGRRTQGHCKGLSRHSHRNSGNKESCGFLSMGPLCQAYGV
ncbi:hypothetical protein TNIN_174261, partial [Trichonephila inaurata madagascariensis]